MSVIFTNNSEINLGKATKKVLHGRDWIVAPMTMLKEGIYNGSQGPIYYPASENKKSEKSWNHTPIVINHPQNEVGGFISARDATVLEERGVGMVLQTNGKSGDLKADAWFDVLRVEQIEPELLKVLNDAIDGTPDKAIEVSTGLHLVPKEEIGVWNNMQYTRVASEYEPDHLAVLLNQPGSCSVAAGCGLFVNSQEELDKGLTKVEKQTNTLPIVRKAMLLEMSDAEMVANEACFSEVEDAIRAALRESDFVIYDSGWIEAVFVDRFIFRFRNKFYVQAYTMDGAVAKLSGSYKEVTRRVEYDPVVQVVTNSVPGKNTMDKITLIAALLATNGSGWTQAELESMSESVLTKIHAGVTAATPAPVANAAPVACGCKAQPAAVVPAAPVANAAPVAPVANAHAALPSWWEMVPADEKMLIQDAMGLMKETRNKHVQVILGAPGNLLTANTLNNLGTGELAAMSSLVANSVKAQQDAQVAIKQAQDDAAAAKAQAQSPFFDYRGQSGPVTTPVANAAGGAAPATPAAPARTPLRMLSTFGAN